jgi:hypothetical protein
VGREARSGQDLVHTYNFEGKLPIDPTKVTDLYNTKYLGSRGEATSAPTPEAVAANPAPTPTPEPNSDMAPSQRLGKTDESDP